MKLSETAMVTLFLQGTITESTPGESVPIAVGSGLDDSGLILTVEVTGSSPLETGDYFTWEVRPDNLTFEIEVEGVQSTAYSFADGATFTDVDTFVDAFNALIVGTGLDDYLMINDNGTPCLRTQIAGERIQVIDTEAWALEVGISKWAFDIPRSYVQGLNTGPFTITSSNNRGTFTVVGSDATVQLEASIPNGTLTVEEVATALHPGGAVAGERYYEAISLQVTDTDTRVNCKSTSS